MRLKNSFVLATIGTMVCAATALGQIQSNGSGGGDWSSTSTWSGGTVPGMNDDVIILPDDTVTVDQNASAATLEIRRDALVNFGSASSSITLTVVDPDGLTIKDNTGGTDPGVLNVNNGASFPRILDLAGGSAAMGFFSFDGEVHLADAKSFLDVPASTTVGGVGSVLLEHNDSAIRVDENVTLTLDTNGTIEGAGQIARLSGSSAANFVNKGMVVANLANTNADTFELASDVALSGAGDWVANVSGATLDFQREFTCSTMSANFSIASNGAMFFTGTSSTLGTFSCTNGGSVSGTLNYGVDTDCANGTAATGCDG